MPGGIDPHTHLEMPFMGTYSSDDFESGTRAALSGGTTMVVDFCLPAPDQSLLTAIQAWDNKSTRATTDYSFHMAITWWGEQVFNEMPEVVTAAGDIGLLSLMVHAGLAKSNGDARRLIKQGAVRINDKRVDDERMILSPENGMILKSGKRGFAKIIIN